MNKILLWFSKSQIKTLNGEYVRTQDILLPNNRHQEIAIFSGDSTLYIGQCTALKTILIHESVFGNAQEFDYVFTHEMAHKDQWWSLFIFPIALFCIFGATASLGITLATIIQTLIQRNYGNLSFIPIGLLVAISFIVIFGGFSWLMELDADFKAIKKVGFNTYLNIKNKPTKQKHSRTQKIIIWVTHPPTNGTSWFWRKFHKL